MFKRMIISEEEKNEIKSKYGLLNEQSDMPFTIASIKETTYPEATQKTYTIAYVEGNVKINGQMATKNMTVKPTDKIVMTNGSNVLFNPIPKFGQTSLDFYDSKPSLSVTTD